jgi:hypothetical protein
MERMTEYIVRAERKLGEMLKAAKAAGQLNPGGNRQSIVDGDDNGPKLADCGISRDLSSRAQKIAAVLDGAERMLYPMRTALLFSSSTRIGLNPFKTLMSRATTLRLISQMPISVAKAAGQITKNPPQQQSTCR